MNSTKIKDLGKLFTSKGYNVVIGNAYTKQQEWLSYFVGSVPNVHHMTRKTMSGHRVDVIKPSLQMPKKVAEEWTSLLYNEKVSLITGVLPSSRISNRKGAIFWLASCIRTSGRESKRSLVDRRISNWHILSLSDGGSEHFMENHPVKINKLKF